MANTRTTRSTTVDANEAVASVAIGAQDAHTVRVLQQAERGEPPLVVDVPGGRQSVAGYMRNEARFRMVEKLDPEGFKRYATGAQRAAVRRIAVYEHIAKLRFPQATATTGAAAPRQE